MSIFLLHAYLFLSVNILSAKSAVFIIKPQQGFSFSAGQDVTVEWLDDGEKPLLSDFGRSTVGLYHGQQQLIQSIAPVDVSASHSLTFKPIKGAGPDSGGYISFTSTTLEGSNGTSYSPFFSLENMDGSFASPLKSATTSIPFTSAATLSPADTDLSTSTVGTLSTSLSPIPSLSPSSFTGSSRFVTSSPPTTSISLSSTTAASGSTSGQSPNGSIRRCSPDMSLITFSGLLLFLASHFLRDSV